jgi:hypothetical protein
VCVPQVHAPLVQPSASVVLQDVHAPPLLPQFVTEGVSQVLPEQHPFVHVCAQPRHALLTQAPGAHEAHATPPEPQANCALPGWQTLFAQHPPGQPTELQMHAPPTHASPGPQGALFPHMHAPPTHESLVVGSHTLQLPPPAPQVESDGGLHVAPLQHPVGHEVESQTHLPL